MHSLMWNRLTVTSRFDYINGDVAFTLQQRGLLVVVGIVFRTLFILGVG